MFIRYSLTWFEEKTYLIHENEIPFRFDDYLMRNIAHKVSVGSPIINSDPL